MTIVEKVYVRTSFPSVVFLFGTGLEHIRFEPR